MVRWLGAKGSCRGAVEVTIEKKSWDQIMEHPESQAFELSTPFHEKETADDVFVREWWRNWCIKISPAIPECCPFF